MFVSDTPTTLVVGAEESPMPLRPEVTKRYDPQETVIYIGEAEWGAAESDPVWTIFKTTLDVDGNPTGTLTTREHEAVWENRLAETYG